MRLVSYGIPGKERAALLLAAPVGTGPGWVLDIARGISDASSAGFPASVREILRDGHLPGLAALLPALRARLASAGREAFPAGACFLQSEVRLGPPVPDPSKIICVGLNYRDHAREQGKEPPAQPLIFAKAPSALSGPADPIRITPGITQTDYELELGVVIGCTASRIAAGDAMGCVAGYLLFLDITDREAQYGDKQWFRGKSHDTFAPSGPWLLCNETVAGATALAPLAMRLEVNGKVEQDSSTAEMIHSVAELIAYITRTITLVPGDIIATGTPAGVGIFQKPPRFLQPGDRIRAEIETLGVLETSVEQEPRST